MNVIAFFDFFDFQVTPSGRLSVVGSHVLNKHIITHIPRSFLIENLYLKLVLTGDMLLFSFAFAISFLFYCILFVIYSVLHHFQSRLRHATLSIHCANKNVFHPQTNLHTLICVKHKFMLVAESTWSKLVRFFFIPGPVWTTSSKFQHRSLLYRCIHIENCLMYKSP